jgi:predicted ATPase
LKIANAKATFAKVFDMRNFYAHENTECVRIDVGSQSAGAINICVKKHVGAPRAAQMAHEQGALFWELRAALSVARLSLSQGRAREARAQLALVYDRFTEGFATADMQAARTLL